MANVLFEPQGDGVFLPTEAALGPWAEGTLHGGPVNGLLTRAIEHEATDAGLTVARLTIDLFRAVPQRPLALLVRRVRQGRRILVVDAELHDGEAITARATGLLLRGEAGQAPSQGEDATPPPPDGLPEQKMAMRGPPGARRRPGYNDAMHERWVSDPNGDEPATIWFRYALPVVPGEEPSPLVRLALVTDYVSGLARGRRRGPGPSTINADLTLYLSRPPEREWMCLEVLGRETGPRGLGFARANLYDETGRIGMAASAFLPNTMR
jgi:hypothetical protein